MGAGLKTEESLIATMDDMKCLSENTVTLCIHKMCCIILVILGAETS